MSPSDAGGRPARSALLELIARWREDAAVADGDGAHAWAQQARLCAADLEMALAAGACADELETALEAAGLAAGDRPSLDKREVDESALRLWLWSHHGCLPSALYGDDGELQCSGSAHRPLDFKRDRLSRLVMECIVAVGARPAPQEPDAQRFGVYRKLKGHTGVGMLYQFLLLARDHTTGAESVVYIPLRVEPEWAGTIRPCSLARDQFNETFEFVSEGLPARPVSSPASASPHQHEWKLATQADGSYISYDMNPPLYDFRCSCGATRRMTEQESKVAAPVLPEPPQNQQVPSVRDLALNARWAALSQVHLDYIERAADPKRHGEDEDKAYTAVRGCAKWANAFINGVALQVRSMVAAEYPNQAGRKATEPTGSWSPSTDSPVRLPAILGTLPRYHVFFRERDGVTMQIYEGSPDGPMCRSEDVEALVAALQQEIAQLKEQTR